MKIAENKVLIFKALIENDDTEDLYKRKLEEAGLSVKNVPVIDFEYFNLNELQQCLQNAENFAGLVFTSPRGVHAVKLCVKTVQNLSSKWKKLPTFVVGEGTAQVLQSQLGLEGQGQEAGSATNLVEFISRSSYARPLLFPCGSLKRDTLPRQLTEKGIAVHMVTVYKTLPHPQLESNLRCIINFEEAFPEYIVYFSPSGLKFSLPTLEKLEVPLHHLKIVAIGPTTESAIRESQLPVWSICSNPTPDDLVSAILK